MPRVSRFPKPSWHFVALRGTSWLPGSLRRAWHLYKPRLPQHRSITGITDPMVVEDAVARKGQRFPKVLKSKGKGAWLPRHFRSHRSHKSHRSHRSGLLQNLKHQPIQERERERGESGRGGEGESGRAGERESGRAGERERESERERERENLGLQNSKYSSQERISLTYLSNAGVPKQLSATCRWRLWCFVLHLPFEDNRMEAIRDLLKHSEAQPQPATAKVWHSLTWTFQVSQGSTDRNLGHCFTMFHSLSFCSLKNIAIIGFSLKIFKFQLSLWRLDETHHFWIPSHCTFHVCPGILRWGSAGNSMGQTSTRAVGSIQLDVAWFARAKKMSETQRGWQLELPLTGSAVERNYGNYSYDWLWHAWERNKKMIVTVTW